MRLSPFLVWLWLGCVLGAEPDDRQFTQVLLVFYEPQDPSCSVGASYLDPSGTVASGFPNSDQMNSISWSFVRRSESGDVYRVSRTLRHKDVITSEPLETKEVVYSGGRLVVFTEPHIVTFQDEFPNET